MNRTASARWTGPASQGVGTLSAASGVLDETPFTFEARFREPNPSHTTPEELLAAAHASCYAMSLGFALEAAGHPAEHLDVQASVAFEAVEGGFEIQGIRLTLQATAPGLSPEALAEFARAAQALCPLSLALHSVPVTLEISDAG